MWTEFREFALRGNVVDMAVGIIIGAAFGQVIQSMVTNVIMPPIGVLLGNVDFSNFFLVLKEGPKIPGPYTTIARAHAAGAVTLDYGVFVNTLVSFAIVAACVFVLIRAMNRMRTPARAPAIRNCPQCDSAISPKARRCPFCTSQLP
ncbi:MAG: large conductance mechanosensitive channel protein MscL [Gammaproteobacteria bacterium]|nr:large conductance mechanosensitive channel protein MscL [Gammaproteobacteria bacterium]